MLTEGDAMAFKQLGLKNGKRRQPRRDEAGRFSSTGKSVKTRRYIRALNGLRSTNRVKAKDIYNSKGGLKSNKGRSKKAVSPRRTARQKGRR